MMKKSFLTPVLSGVLALTVVGSGAAYYFEFVKDSGDGKAKTADESSQSGAVTIDEAAKNIEAQLNKAQQLAKGEYNGAYTAQVTYKPSQSVSDTVGLSTPLSDVSVSVEAKQKDKMTSVNYGFNYGANSVISANMVIDNANETAYFQIPEFSDAYLTGNADDLAALVQEYASAAGTGTVFDEDYSSYDFDDYDSDDSYEASSYTADMMASPAAGLSDLNVDALSDIDFDALLTDLETYGDTIKENAPEATDGADKTGEIDGKSYTLTTKNYTITKEDGKKIAQAVADKAKADETLKGAMTSAGLSEDDYNSMWDGLLTSIDEGDDSALTFDVYYNGDEVQGFKAEGGDDSYQIVNYSTDKQMILDWKFTSDGTDEFVAAGAVDIDGDTINGSVKMTMNDSDETTNVTATYDNLTAGEDSLTGKITINVTDSSDNISMVYDFNNSGTNIDTNIALSANDTDLGTIAITAQENDASDITVPSGTMYNISDDDQLDQYVSSMNGDAWLESLKTTLGEELYNLIFNAQIAGTDNSDFSATASASPANSYLDA